MFKIFTDTSALYAIADKKDENHEESRDLYNKLLLKKAVFLITDNIVAECATLMRRRLGYSKSMDFLELIEEGGAIELFEIVFLERAVFRRAVQIFREMKSVKISFVDALSFATMQDRKISRYFAFDKHFDEAGFENVELELRNF